MRLKGFLVILADLLIIGGIIGSVLTLSWVWLILCIIGLWKLNFYNTLFSLSRDGENK